MGLAENIRNYTTVTGVRQINRQEKTSETQEQVTRADTDAGAVTSDISREENVFSFDTEEDFDDSVSSACSSLTRRRSLSSASFESGCFGPSPSPAPPPLSRSHCDMEPEPSYDLSALSASIGNWDPYINPSLFSQSYTMSPVSDCPGPFKPPEDYCSSLRHCSMARHCCPEADTLFEVTGYHQDPASGVITPFTYMAQNVVLATGQADTPNCLDVPGEDLPVVLHKLSELTRLVRAGELGPASHPVIVVGAGLSAADAIVTAQAHSIPIVHVFRKQARDPSLIFGRWTLLRNYCQAVNISKMINAGCHPSCTRSITVSTR